MNKRKMREKHKRVNNDQENRVIRKTVSGYFALGTFIIAGYQFISGDNVVSMANLVSAALFTACRSIKNNQVGNSVFLAGATAYLFFGSPLTTVVRAAVGSVPAKPDYHV